MATHLLTGAGSGIGSAVAQALHDRGDDLILLTRNDERAAALTQRFPGARTIVTDLADVESVDRIDGIPDRLDSFLHIAGIVELATVAETSTEHLRAQLDVNLVSPLILTRFCCRRCGRHEVWSSS